jgi:mRNA interferase RelE/StbE
MTEENPYIVTLTDEAQDDLKRLDKTVARRIVKKLRWLGANAEIHPHAALTGPWSGFYRLRVGDYRVIYVLDHQERLIEGVVIEHRRDVYDE